MRECIFISKHSFLAFLLLSLTAAYAPKAFADDSSAVPPKQTDRTLNPEDEDFGTTPYTEYGEFNQDEDEAAETRFLQHGRFFGVSLGLGLEGVDGNRGILWKGGFPVFQAKVVYWFDFNFALDMVLFTASHFYTDASDTHVDVNILHLGLNLKYYFDTKNLSAPLSFANPYIVGGGGAFSKGEANAGQNTAETDSVMGLTLGMGLEFPITPRKVYFDLEGKLNIVNFADSHTTEYRSVTAGGIEDLTGRFYTLTGNLLFTW